MLAGLSTRDLVSNSALTGVIWATTRIC